jgi:hypothetical protein
MTFIPKYYIAGICSASVLTVVFLAILNFAGIQILTPSLALIGTGEVNIKDDLCKKTYQPDSYYDPQREACIVHTGYNSFDDYCKATYGSDSFWGTFSSACITHTGYNSWDDYCKATNGPDSFWDASADGCRTHTNYNSWTDFCKASLGSNYFWDTSNEECAVQSPSQGESLVNWNDYCKAANGPDSFYSVSANACIVHTGYNSFDDYCKAANGPDSYFDASQSGCVTQPSQGNTANQGTQGNTANQGTQGNTANQGTQGQNLGTTITPARNLSGNWSGSFSMKDTSSDGCSFSGTWEATLTQNDNDLSGSFSIIGASSPDYPANDYCTLDPGTFPFEGGTVSSSSFQFDASGLGEFHVKGYFTSDLIHGNFNECYDGSCATGTFTGSRG